MVKYPVRVKRCNYRGKNQQQLEDAYTRNMIAVRLENHINGLLEQQSAPIQVYTYDEIAHATGYSQDLVRDLCFCIGCGSGGFTAIRKDLTFEQAMTLRDSHLSSTG
ncbi:MAG: hypothetical protein AMXMBFR58_07620 [Phycisphaerae bacterium]